MRLTVLLEDLLLVRVRLLTVTQIVLNFAHTYATARLNIYG